MLVADNTLQKQTRSPMRAASTSAAIATIASYAAAATTALAVSAG